MSEVINFPKPSPDQAAVEARREDRASDVRAPGESSSQRRPLCQRRAGIEAVEASRPKKKRARKAA